MEVKEMEVKEGRVVNGGAAPVRTSYRGGVGDHLYPFGWLVGR